jgi:DNA polymerase-3 subunit epsilon
VTQTPAPRILAIDFETANYDGHSACQLGVARIQDWAVTGSQAWLIRPPSPDFVFTYIHGLEWAHVKDAPSWAQLWPQLQPWFDGVDYFAAHNAPFDRGVLQKACGFYGLSAPSQPFIDTVQVARQAWKIYPTKLNNVCERLGIQLQHHEALSDATACAQIVVQAAAQGWRP